MFRKSEATRKRGSFLPLVLFRLGLSLTILAVFALGIYQAFLYFSGQKLTDFTQTNPRALVMTLLTSDDISKTISSVLGINLPTKGIVPAPGNSSDSVPGPRPTPSGRMVLKFAVVADSHKDNNNLAQALSQAKADGAKFVIGLGDYSDTGTAEELQKAKQVIDSSGLPVYLTAGDHDLWDSRDKGRMATANFSDVFGSPYQSFAASSIRFILLFNGDNYEGVDGLQKAWVEDLLQNSDSQSKVKKTFVFLHEPVYHPTSDRYMGSARKTNEGKEPNKKLLEQAEDLRELFKRVGVAEVFAGDIHAYSSYDDPEYGLRMTTVGALTSERNSQKPRFVMVDVYEDGNYNISDTEIK